MEPLLYSDNTPNNLEYGNNRGIKEIDRKIIDEERNID
jgi:hypothetical protein